MIDPMMERRLQEMREFEAWQRAHNRRRARRRRLERLRALARWFGLS